MKYAKDRLEEWRIALIVGESLQIAHIGVAYSTDTQTHIHLLMLGKNVLGKTLSDVEGRKWEKKWEHGKATMEPIESEIGADFYIQSHMTANKPDSWEVLPFNTQLLKQLRYKQTIYCVEDSLRLALS